MFDEYFCIQPSADFCDEAELADTPHQLETTTAITIFGSHYLIIHCSLSHL
jgi:hypothetical protein